MNHQLEIKRPCSENYNNFAPTKIGGFCEACQKEVIDFTKFKNEDIAKYFQLNSENNTCGRFTQGQLQQSYKAPKNRLFNFITRIGITLLAFFSSFSAEAQDIEPSTKTLDDDNSIEVKKDVANITVKGTVVTESDGLPLPGANVMLQGSKVGTSTDFDGYFEFPQKLKKGDVLIVYYVGMDSKKIIIENKKSAELIELELNMELTCMVVGEVAVKEIFKSKKN